MTDEKIDLGFIARQQNTVIGELRPIRDDMAVMMEILRRIEHRSGEHDRRMDSLATEMAQIGAQLTAMHAYNRRVEERVKKLEDSHF